MRTRFPRAALPAALVVATILASGTAIAAAAGDTPATRSTVAALAPPMYQVQGTRFVDAHGREVVLRGFNVSGTVKLSEHNNLPFASLADARRSAAAMKQLGGANTVRFLLSWAAAEPAPGQYDATYLRKVTEQIGAFADQGIAVLLDYHQDMFSRYVFNKDSWYTGDGAPEWVVRAGQYPKEYCGICPFWGQNITQNAAVQNSTYDFWHNRTLQTPAGPVGMQDAFLRQAEHTLGYIARGLTAEQLPKLIGVNPLNEPYAGRYDSGQDARSWERDLLMPFYLKFRTVMDSAGLAQRPAFIEPNMFWNGNLSRQPGGFLDQASLGSRFVFNTHFYDQKAISGVFMWGKAKDGQHSADFDLIRQRASALNTAAIVTEFGHPLSGHTSDKAPSILKGVYQGLDSRLPGAQWWTKAAQSGPVLSGTQWQWDVNSGRHHELMNGNPNKVLTEADAWNDEDFSAVRIDDAGNPVLRMDARLIDRVYPAAVAGQTLAFTYEDRSRDGSTTMTWNPVPTSLPAVRALVGSGRYAVIVWRSGAAVAPTEVHLPAGFTPTVVSDVAATVSAGRLSLAASGSSGVLHYALVTDSPATDNARDAAKAELARWASSSFTR